VIAGDERIDIKPGHATPRPALSLDGVFYGGRICHGVLVCLRRTADGRMHVAGADPRSGQVLWRHEPMSDSRYGASRWRHLMSHDHHDPDVFIAPDLTYHGRRIELIDWRTGRSAWTVPWLGRAWPSAADAPEYYYVCRAARQAAGCIVCGQVQAKLESRCARQAAFAQGRMRPRPSCVGSGRRASAVLA